MDITDRNRITAKSVINYLAFNFKIYTMKPVLTEEQKALIKYDLFKEVFETNLQSFINRANNDAFDYGALNINKILNLSDDEIRSLAVNFFTKTLTKKLNENIDFYFDKKL